MMNISSNENIPYQCTTSACERNKIADFNHICPSKLSKHELEDLYFSLVQNNMELKKTINRQGEKMKVMSTRLQRMSTVQKAERGKEKDCCPATKAVVKDQRESIVELKKANERLTERIRQLSMRLCSTKQFLKRPSQAGTRCAKCLMGPSLGSGKNISTSALNLRKSDANIQTSSVSCQCLDKEPKSPKSVEDKSGDGKMRNISQDSRHKYSVARPVGMKSTEMIYNEKGEKKREPKSSKPDHTAVSEKIKDTSPAPSPRTKLNHGSKEQKGESRLKSMRSAEKSSERHKEPMSKETQCKEVSQQSCDDNRCRTLMEELKQKIANLQEEHKEYSARISRLEEEVIDLHSENLRLVSDSAARAHSLERRERDARDVAGRLRDAEAQSGNLSTQLAIEKSKVSELETQVKAASLSGQVARAIEGHFSKKDVQMLTQYEYGNETDDARSLCAGRRGSPATPPPSPLYAAKATLPSKTPLTSWGENAARTTQSKSPRVNDDVTSAFVPASKSSPVYESVPIKGSESACEGDIARLTSEPASKTSPIRQSASLKESKLSSENKNDSDDARSASAPASIEPFSLPPASSKEFESESKCNGLEKNNDEQLTSATASVPPLNNSKEGNITQDNESNSVQFSTKFDPKCTSPICSSGASKEMSSKLYEDESNDLAASVKAALMPLEQPSTDVKGGKLKAVCECHVVSADTRRISKDAKSKVQCECDVDTSGTRPLKESKSKVHCECCEAVGASVELEATEAPLTASAKSHAETPLTQPQMEKIIEMSAGENNSANVADSSLPNSLVESHQKVLKSKEQTEKEEEYGEDENEGERVPREMSPPTDASSPEPDMTLVPNVTVLTEPKSMEPCVCSVETAAEIEGVRQLSVSSRTSLIQSGLKSLQVQEALTVQFPLGVSSEMDESPLCQGCFDDSGYADQSKTTEDLALINEHLMEKIAYLQKQLAAVVSNDLQSASKDVSTERSKSENKKSAVDPYEDKLKSCSDVSNRFIDSSIKRDDIAISEKISDTKVQSTPNSLKENSLKIEDAHNRYQIPGPLPVSIHRGSIDVATRRVSNVLLDSRRSSRSQKEKKDDRDNAKSTKSVKVFADDSLNFVFKDNKIVPVDHDHSEKTDNQVRDKEIPDDIAKEEDERKYFLNDIDPTQTQEKDDKQMPSDVAKPKQDLNYWDDIASIQTQAKDANNLTEPIETRDLYKYIDSIQIRAKVESKTAKDDAKSDQTKPDFYDDIDSVQSGNAKIDVMKSDVSSAVNDAKDTRDILPQRPTDASNPVDPVTESPLSLYIPPTMLVNTPYQAKSEQATDFKEDNQLDICERMTHVCTCPHAARRDVAVFRSCSGTLRFKTTSITSSKFRRCKCCRKPPKMITCGTQAEVENDSPSDQDIQADLTNVTKLQDFSAQVQKLPQGQPSKTDRNVEGSAYIDQPQLSVQNQQNLAQEYPSGTEGKTRQQSFQSDRRRSHDSRLFYEYQLQATSDRTRDDEIVGTSPLRMFCQNRRSQADRIDFTPSPQKLQNEHVENVSKPTTSRQERRSQDFHIDDPSSRQKRTSQNFQINYDDRPQISRRDQRSQKNELENLSQRRQSRRDRKSEDKEPRTYRSDKNPDLILPSQAFNVGGTLRGDNEQLYKSDRRETRRQEKRGMVDEGIQAYTPRDDELQDQPFRQLEPCSASSSQPRTYVIAGSAEVVKCTRGTSSDNTDYDVSLMVSEKAPNSSQTAPLSPGETRSIGSATDSYTVTGEQGQLSEGEMPADGGTACIETSTTVKPPDANPGDVGGRGSGSSQKMEEALQAIGEELARCRQLLMGTQRTREVQESKDAAATADLRPSGPIVLRKSDGKSRIGDAFTPKCIFTLHIGTIVLSDEAVINSRDMSLMLTWKFHDQNLAMTRMRAGRVVHFDFSTEYDVRLTEEFLEYLKHEEMSIRICEVDKQEEPFAYCSLPLRDALLHTNRRADMSLALVAGPRMRRSRAVADALDAGDEMGVLDLWCMLRAEPRLLPHINRAIAKSGSAAATANSGSRSSGSLRPSMAGPIMAQISEDDQDEYRLSNDLDFVPSARRTLIRYSEDGSTFSSFVRPHDVIENRTPPKQERSKFAYRRDSSTPAALTSGVGPCRVPPDHLAAPAALMTGPGPRIDGFTAQLNTDEAKLHDCPTRGQVSFEKQESQTSSGIIINEVPANIKSTVEMKTALEKSRNTEPSLRKPEDGLQSPSMLSVKSLLGRPAKEKRQRLSLSDYSQYGNTSPNINDTGSGKYKILSVRDDQSKGSAREDSDNTVENRKYDNANKLLVTKKALDAFKRVKIKQKREPSYFQSEPTKSQSITITILWLALSEECEAMVDPGIQRLYVAYSFLGRDGAELETPISLPKPKQYQDKCFFDFKQSFQLTDSDLPRLGRLARCRSPAKGAPSPRDCVVFTVVSEPMEDPLALHDCEDIGYAHLFFGDLLAYSVDSDSYTEVLPVLVARGGGAVCGVLAVKMMSFAKRQKLQTHIQTDK